MPSSETKVVTQLVDLIETKEADLFHDDQGRGYVALTVDGHRETYSLASSSFGHLLGGLAYGSLLEAVNSAVKDAVEVLKGLALHKGPERTVYVRLGHHEGRTYLDLADPQWRAVEVGPDGWRVVDRPPVYFRRHSGMKALPAPVSGGKLSELRYLLNLGDERNVLLVTGSLLGTLSPKGPYPILVLHGEQGSAKSTVAQSLRYLVDPHVTPLRPDPRTEQNLSLAAQRNWVVAFDNLSLVRPWLSDALCRIATGAGFGTRQLYTDEEEVLVRVCRPVMLNGIAAEMVSRPDLLDRALVLELPAISDRERRTEGDVLGRLKEARPKLLGALLDAASAGLRHLPAVQQEKLELPRMADFAVWGEACGRGLGWEPRSFIAALKESRELQDHQALGVWSVMPYLDRLLASSGSFEGTVSQLLNELNGQSELLDPKPLDWPRTARQLGEELKRYKPSLRRRGIEVQRLGHTRYGYRLRITLKQLTADVG
jgi:hypothetical protein